MLRREDVWHPRMGAPPGNRNRLKNGRYTKDAKALRARIRDLRRRVKIALAVVNETLDARAWATNRSA